MPLIRLLAPFFRLSVTLNFLSSQFSPATAAADTPIATAPVIQAGAVAPKTKPAKAAPALAAAVAATVVPAALAASILDVWPLFHFR